MVIRSIVEKDIPNLINFNIKMYKERDKIEESIKYRFIDNPIKETPFEKSLIALDENDGITGQVLLMPTEFWFEGKRHMAFWDIDYIVSEENRGSYTGIILAMKAVKAKYHFGITMTEKALNIHLALKQKIIGYLKRYFRIINLLSVCRSIIYRNQSIRSYNYPQAIDVKGGKFIKTQDPSILISKEGYWNHDVVEFSRDEKSINWRFFYYKDKYCVYKYYSNERHKDEKPTFFVIRPIIWRNLNCLLLVDYRFPLDRKENLDRILKASKMVAQKLRMAAIIACSSLPKLDRTLKRNLFINYGKKTEILTNLEKSNYPNAFRKDSILITFADSDMDLNYST